MRVKGSRDSLQGPGEVPLYFAGGGTLGDAGVSLPLGEAGVCLPLGDAGVCLPLRSACSQYWRSALP